MASQRSKAMRPAPMRSLWKLTATDSWCYSPNSAPSALLISRTRTLRSTRELRICGWRWSRRRGIRFTESRITTTKSSLATPRSWSWPASASKAIEEWKQTIMAQSKSSSRSIQRICCTLDGLPSQLIPTPANNKPWRTINSSSRPNALRRLRINSTC